MGKKEIWNKILNISSREETIEFVYSRIEELERDLQETTIGKEHKTRYRDYISPSKTKSIVGQIYEEDSDTNEKRLKRELPNLKFDDEMPYINLIDTISSHKEVDWLDELSLLTAIIHNIIDYLGNFELNANVEERRVDLYIETTDEEISIKKFHDEKIGMCFEFAGLAQNIFKILGLDSEIVMSKMKTIEKGECIEQFHAFNIIYPNGYDDDLAVLTDFCVPFYFLPSDISDMDKWLILPTLKVLAKEDFDELSTSHWIEVNPKDSIKSTLLFENINIKNDDCIFLYYIDNNEKANDSLDRNKQYIKTV